MKNLEELKAENVVMEEIETLFTWYDNGSYQSIAINDRDEVLKDKIVEIIKSIHVFIMALEKTDNFITEVEEKINQIEKMKLEKTDNFITEAKVKITQIKKEYYKDLRKYNDLVNDVKGYIYCKPYYKCFF